MVGFRPPYVLSKATRAAAMAYCHANPVRHGFAAHPRDWPLSTVHRREPASAHGETPQVGLPPDLQWRRAYHAAECTGA